MNLKLGISAAYLLAVNIITFAAFVVDKSRAVKHRFRIKEITLLGLSLIGGSAGGLIAMYSLRHKTKKPLFTVCVPLMLVLQAAAVFIILKN